MADFTGTGAADNINGTDLANRLSDSAAPTI